MLFLTYRIVKRQFVLTFVVIYGHCSFVYENFYFCSKNIGYKELQTEYKIAITKFAIIK